MAPEAPSPVAVYRTACAPPRTVNDPDAIVEVIALWDDDERLTVAHLAQGDRFVLSSRGASRADAARLVIPSHTGPDHTLVRVRGDVVAVSPPEGAAFELSDPVQLRLGRVTVSVRRVSRGEKVPPSRFGRFFSVPFALSIVTTWGLSVMPVPPRDEHAIAQQRKLLHDLSLAHAAPPPPVAYVPVHARTEGASEGGTGHRATGHEGRAGRDHTPARNRRWAQRPSTPRPAPSRFALELALAHGASTRSGIAPDEAATFMPDATEASPHTGNMYGDAEGTSRGVNALGLLGTGFGGGGAGEALIGLGLMPTRGHGNHDTAGQGLGQGGWGCGCGEMAQRGFGRTTARYAVRVGTRASSSPTVCNRREEADVEGATDCVPAEVLGLLDAVSVRRVVRMNLGQIRHCYERALDENPSAEGSLSMRWVIGADGAVTATSVEESSVPVASLSTCVSAAVRRWRFPMPGELTAVVRYPFSFSRDAL